MRFNSFIVSGLFAIVASAQTVTSAAETSTVSSASPAQSSATEIEKCLDACDESDTKCRAHCIAVPSPNNQNVNQTTSCVADCPQGNGTAADNKAYADCVDGCIAQYYFTNTGTPDLATSTGAGGASGSDSSVTQVPTTITSGGSTITTMVPSTTQSEEGSSPSTTSSSRAAAPTLYAHAGTIGTGLGFLGLLAGVFAL